MLNLVVGSAEHALLIWNHTYAFAIGLERISRLAYVHRTTLLARQPGKLTRIT